MKQLHPLLKLATVASSIILVSGFVSYRAGAFNWLVEASAAPADPEPNVNDILVSVPEESSGSLLFMVGSKSDAGLIRLPPQQKSPATQPQPPSPASTPSKPTLLPGSKSAKIVLPTPSLSDSASPSTPATSSK